MTNPNETLNKNPDDNRKRDEAISDFLIKQEGAINQLRCYMEALSWNDNSNPSLQEELITEVNRLTDDIERLSNAIIGYLPRRKN